MKAVKSVDLGECVSTALEAYFHALDGEKPTTIYEMVIKVVEKAMLQKVLRQTCDNQSEAAKMLGINRNTLRKKIQDYQILPLENQEKS